MEDYSKVDISLVVACIVLTVLLLGGWILFCAIVWPPSLLQIIITVIGISVGLAYCLDRYRHWDVQAWQWYEPTRNRTYAPIVYRLVTFGGAFGVVVARILDNVFNKDINDALTSAGLAGMGIVFAWYTIEACENRLYHRGK